MEKVTPIIKRYKNKEWKPFLGTVLPQSAIDYFSKETEEHGWKYGNAWKSGYANWILGTIYFAGSDNPEKATKWIAAFDDGGYYKVDAEYSFWHQSKTGEKVLQCCWSYNHLKKTMRSFIETGVTAHDPDYQT